MATPVDALDLGTLDVTDPRWPEDAYGMLAALREQHWLARTPHGLTVLTHADHRVFIADRRCRTPGIDMLEAQGVTSGVLHDFFRGLLVSLDGEEHQRLRRLVSRSFTPRAISGLDPVMREVFGGLLDPVLPRGRADGVELVAEYPIPIICALFGAPADDWELFSRTAPSILKLFNPDLAANLAEIEGALIEINDYLDRLIAAKRASPGDDLLSRLIEVEEEGDRLTHDELVMLTGAILLGGTDTTRMHLANALALFCEHPDQWQLLRRRPELAAQAADEVLRYCPSISDNFRVTKEDIEHKGVLIPAGTPLGLSVLAANRDPAVFEDPNVFDITRDAGQLFTFGGGMHYCLGAGLARKEMTVALDMMSRSMADLAADGPAGWPTGFSNTWTPSSLPIRFTPVPDPGAGGSAGGQDR